MEERGEEGIETTPDRQYTWGLRDRWDLLRRKRSTTNPLDETLYVLRDYLDPVAIADAAGNVVERYAYDAFGNVRFLDQNYGSRSSSSYAWDFLFHGEFRDPETKLYNYGHRYYDTGLGRWLSRDPIGEKGGVNLYGYVGNSPANRSDELGMFPADFIQKYQQRFGTSPGSNVMYGYDNGPIRAGDYGLSPNDYLDRTIGMLLAFEHDKGVDVTNDVHHLLKQQGVWAKKKEAFILKEEEQQKLEWDQLKIFGGVISLVFNVVRNKVPYGIPFLLRNTYMYSKHQAELEARANQASLEEFMGH